MTKRLSLLLLVLFCLVWHSPVTTHGVDQTLKKIWSVDTGG